VISAAGTRLNTLVQLDPIYATFNSARRPTCRGDRFLRFSFFFCKARAKGPVPVRVRNER